MLDQTRSGTVSPKDFAIQSTPKHVAIIMDGNRRWARERRLPAAAGHRAGVETLRRLLPVVADSRVETLTVFGFSCANWGRERAEVTSLLGLAEEALARFGPLCRARGIQVEIIGRRDRLPAGLVRAIVRLEAATRDGRRRLRIAIDYSSRETILAAARRLEADVAPAALSRLLSPHGDVDLLIRTGREQRLSDFLLWECAFAELRFPDLLWPDFDGQAFAEALAWYAGRDRRYGA